MDNASIDKINFEDKRTILEIGKAVISMMDNYTQTIENHIDEEKNKIEDSEPWASSIYFLEN